MEIKKEIAIIDETTIKDKIYTIRGEQVMLDFELAEIYGYSTKAFNQQVRNNIQKFEGYMFQLTEYEVLEISRCKNSTSIMQGPGIKGGRTSLPYAFTESGIYMLMTVLRGPLATEQSRKLINVFKAMKDYIVSSNHLLSMNEVIGLVNKVNKHDDEIKDVKNQLTVVMDNFIDPSKYEEFQILDGMKIEAQEIYKTIFRMAKKSIYILDNYISTRTLKYLKICSSHIEIIIVSDNISFDGIDEKDLEVFKNETGIEIPLLKGYGRLHDRYIVIDYDTPNEIIYHSGSSLKDAGNKIATVDKLSDTFLLHDVIKELITR